MAQLDGVAVPSADSLTYGSYLKIPELLDLQHPVSQPMEHDETLFIIIHQVYELWFKQILHEIDFCVEAFKKLDVMQAMRILNRVLTIQDTLIKQVDILETMTPPDFNRFRERLNPASGFQSVQFRLLEYRLGERNRAYLKFYRQNENDQQQLLSALNLPTLYDHFLRLLAKRGYAIPTAVTERDVTQMYILNEDVEKAILSIYEHANDQYPFYLLCETMVGLDQKIILWRYRHVSMVERMIGNRQGTGGSSGASYLAATLEKKFFPELWQVRNLLK